MKTNRMIQQMARLACVAALAALAGSDSLQAQTWQTVLDYQYPGGTATGGSIVADASGKVFSGGNASDAAGITRGMVLQTDTAQLANPDPGAINWYFSDDTNPNPSQYESFVWNLGLDASGNLYSVGQLTPPFSTSLSSWYVCKREAVSGIWSPVDNYQPYQLAAGQSMNARGFAADDSGNIYVAGYGQEPPKKRNQLAGRHHWLVRKSTDGGANWTLVDDHDLAGPMYKDGATGAGFVPGVGVFVVGYSWDSSWVVRRSASGNLGTWSTVGGPFSGSAQAVGSDGQGNIYVVGSQTITVTIKTRPPTTSSYDAWVTRMSKDGGNTWSTVDTFSYAPNNLSKAFGIGSDANGNVVVVGRGRDAQGQTHWLVRKIVAGTWTTVDDFQLAPGSLASASGVATDDAGNLLVAGTARDATSREHWIVRKLAP